MKTWKVLLLAALLTALFFVWPRAASYLLFVIVLPLFMSGAREEESDLENTP